MAHRLALATLAATAVLIVLGGLVTNTGAALAVPDWPSTFGHNMFLFPWSRMVGGVFYEHSHRLAGALVGLLTVTLAAALWREGGRLRQLGLVAVAVVLAQGLVGGLASDRGASAGRPSAGGQSRAGRRRGPRGAGIHGRDSRLCSEI